MADQDEVSALKDHPELAGEVLERLGYEAFERALMSLDYFLRAEVLEAGLPPAVLARLARTECEDLRSQVAEVPGFDDDTVRHLLAVGRRHTRRAVLRYQDLSEAARRSLAADPKADVRETVAWMGCTPVEMLCTLTTDVKATVRRAAVSNEQTPPTMVVSRGLDPDVEVRRIVIARTLGFAGEAGVAELCRELAQDEDVPIREAVAAHPSTPTGVRALLASDPELSVRVTVAQAAATPVEVLTQHSAHDRSAYVRIAVMSHPAVPPSVLVRLAADEDRDVRAGVADHRHTPVDALAQLAVDAEPSVREVVAMRPELPERVLRAFAHERNALVNERLRERRPT